MNVDRVNPWTGAPTKVPFYSTYLSLQWLTVNLKSQLFNIGHSSSRSIGGLSHRQEKEVFTYAASLAISVGEYYAPNGLIKLVPKEKREEYIRALDEYYDKYGQYMDKATWFKGQHIEIDLFGRFTYGVSTLVQVVHVAIALFYPSDHSYFLFFFVLTVG